MKIARLQVIRPSWTDSKPMELPSWLLADGWSVPNRGTPMWNRYSNCPSIKWQCTSTDFHQGRYCFLLMFSTNFILKCHLWYVADGTAAGFQTRSTRLRMKMIFELSYWIVRTDFIDKRRRFQGISWMLASSFIRSGRGLFIRPNL